MRRIIGTLPATDTTVPMTTVTPKKKGNKLVDALPLLGGIVGGTAGTVVPGLGNIVGSGVGAAAGEALKRRINKTGSVMASKEGALEDIVPVLGEGAVGIVGAGVGKGLGWAAGKAGGALKATGKRAADKLAATVAKATPAAYQKAADAGISINKIVRSWLPKLGKDYDEILGVTEKGAAPGTLKLAIDGAEKTIQDTAKSAGSAVRISGDALKKSIKEQAKLIKSELTSSGNRAESIDAIAKQAEQIYKNGLTVPKALTKLRAANEQFGKNIFADAADSVDTAVQKMEANILRDALRKMFPTIGKALDQQQELIILREALKGGRAKIAGRGFSVSAKEIAQEAIDPLAMKAVSRGGGEVAKEAGESAISAIPGLKGFLAKQGLGQGAAQAGQSFISSPEPVPQELQDILPSTTTEDTAVTENKITPEMVTQAYAILGKEKGDLLKTMYESQSLGSESDKTESQVARESAITMARDLFDDLQKKQIRTGPAAKVEGLKSIFNAADPDTLEFNKKISALKATIAKARAGTSFTPNEEALLNRYTPTEGDSYQNLYTALKILAAFD